MKLDLSSRIYICRLLIYLTRLSTVWGYVVCVGHCHLKRHLFKQGLTDDLICERCLEEDESDIHDLCDCEATDHLRFRHLGQFFMEPGDAPISKVLKFTRSEGLIKG
jgi:hypothetical protein